MKNLTETRTSMMSKIIIASNSSHPENETETDSLTSTDIVTLTAVTIVTLLAGVILNGFVCVFFLIERKMFNKTANIMIFSITASDFLQSTVASPMLLLALVKREWVFGVEGCRIYGFLMTWFGIVSITHLSALAIERYFSLKYAILNGSGDKGTGRGNQAVLILWLYSLFWSIVPLLGWSNYTLEPSKLSCSVKWYSTTRMDLSYNICLIIFCFIIPVGFIIVFYFLMSLTIKNISNRAIVSWGKRASNTRCTIKRERSMIGLVIAMIVAFLIAWTPYVCASLTSMLGYSEAMSPLVTTIASFTAKTSTLYNPILYVYMYRDFKLSLLRYVKLRRDSELSLSFSKFNTPRTRSFKLATMQSRNHATTEKSEEN